MGQCGKCNFEKICKFSINFKTFFKSNCLKLFMVNNIYNIINDDTKAMLKRFSSQSNQPLHYYKFNNGVFMLETNMFFHDNEDGNEFLRLQPNPRIIKKKHEHGL